MIFTEGGKRTGFGHITRCVSLYDEVKRRGIEVELIIHSYDELKELVGSRRYTLMNWYTIDCLAQVIHSNAYCIVDSYIASEKLYQVINERSKAALFLDDTNRIHYPKGIVVHPSLLASDAPSNSLAGPEYIILRDTFREASPVLLQPKVSNVLITLGGTLQPSLLQNMIQVICSKFQEITFHILIGNMAEPLLKEELHLPSNIVLHRYAPSDEMKRLMTNSDLVITAAGQTIYEILALGIPFIPIQIAENQGRNMQALFEKGLIGSKVVWESPIFEENLKKVFIHMLDADVRRRQSNKYDGMVDGKGPRRIIDALLYRREDAVFLREATIEDSQQVFDLSNQQHVRKYSINSNPILWETHQVWYNRILSSQVHYFLVVTDDSNQVLGQIRYELSSNIAVISISLSKKIIGKKVSQPLIRQSLEMVQQEWRGVQKIIAYISNENLASKKTFEKAGFVLDVSELDNVNLLTYIYKIGER